MAPPSYNVVVVGAGESYTPWSSLSIESNCLTVVIGISGLAAAKFYLDVHPDCRLIILEKEKCLGGVWSTSEKFFFLTILEGKDVLGAT